MIKHPYFGPIVTFFFPPFVDLMAMIISTVVTKPRNARGRKVRLVITFFLPLLRILMSCILFVWIKYAL